MQADNAGRIESPGNSACSTAAHRALDQPCAERACTPHPPLQALAIDARRHDALWCLGNAYTSQGFLSAEATSGARGGGAAGPARPVGDLAAAQRAPRPVLPSHISCPAPCPATHITTASDYFDRAGECFQKAVDLEPGNDSYRRALEMSGKAPQLYQELQRQLQAASAGGSPRGADRAAPAKEVRVACGVRRGGAAAAVGLAGAGKHARGWCTARLHCPR